MIDYETPEADALEQDEPVTDDVGADEAVVDLETPEADAAEQHAPAARGGPADLDGALPYDANEADAADQSRVVELDEDDYR